MGDDAKDVAVEVDVKAAEEEEVSGLQVMYVHVEERAMDQSPSLSLFTAQVHANSALCEVTGSANGERGQGSSRAAARSH